MDAIEEEQCGGAGLDVYEEEPPTKEITLKLIQNPKVVATPHLGASTGEAQIRVAVEVAEQFIALAGKSKDYSVTGVVNRKVYDALQKWFVLLLLMLLNICCLCPTNFILILNASMYLGWGDSDSIINTLSCLNSMSIHLKLYAERSGHRISLAAGLIKYAATLPCKLPLFVKESLALSKASEDIEHKTNITCRHLRG